MATFKTKYVHINKDTSEIEIIKKEDFDKFNEGILGLGNIEKKSVPMDALCVMFDLEGFTDFCKQIDPHLAVPEYLSEFLKWIFQEIKQQLISKTHKEGYETWSDLPFLSKYFGDGLLFIWNTKKMDESGILNAVVTMHDICTLYQLNFLKDVSKKIAAPPPKLRCGIARGTIYSVGNGNDYVGPCINMASRLQKLYSLSVCFSRRGLNLDHMTKKYSDLFIVKKVDVRGIGNGELVCILKSEYSDLSELDKANFRD